MKVSLIIIIICSMLTGCVQRPASLEDNLKKYEKLISLSRQDLAMGQILDRAEATGEINALMAQLSIHRLRFDNKGNYVALSGKSNIIGGQYSYLYNLSMTPLDSSEGPTIKREHLNGRWYSERASW